MVWEGRRRKALPYPDQVAIVILRRSMHTGVASATRTPTEVRRSLGLGSAIYLLIAVVIAMLGGWWHSSRSAC